MKSTANYSLKQFEGTDNFDYKVLNENWNKVDTQIKNVSSNATNHIADKNNPHGVTPEQIGAATPNDLNAYVPRAGTALSSPLALSGAFTNGLISLNNTNADYPNSYIRYQAGGVNKAAAGYYDAFAFLSNEVSMGRIGVDDKGNPQYRSSGDASTAKELLHAGNVKNHAVPRTEWTAKIKGATWGRLCNVVPYAIAGTRFILNIVINRSNVIVNDTFIIATNHPKRGTIHKLSGAVYGSTDYNLRVVVDSSGNGYVEIKDAMNGATNTQDLTVYCVIMPIELKELTTYTTATSGETLPTDYAVGAEIRSLGGNDYRKMVDGEEEWDNPPFMDGVEYRTTKRLGEKVVYTKRIHLGESPTSGSSKTVEATPRAAKIISLVGFSRSQDQMVARPLPAYTNDGALAYTVRVTNQTSVTLESHTGASKFTSPYDVYAVVEYINY